MRTLLRGKNTPSRFVAFFNCLWDGKSMTAHKKTSKIFTIDNRRIKLNLMMPPLLMGKPYKTGSSINIQSSLMAKCLTSHPISNMGKLFFNEPSKKNSYLDEFNARITDCLTK